MSNATENQRIVAGTAGGSHVAGAPLTTSATRIASPELLVNSIDLPVSNQSQSAATSAMHGGMLRVRPDAQRVRVLAVQMADWTHAVEPVAFEQAGELLARMASPYSAPGPGSPLAVLMPDGSLQLCPDGEGGLTNLLCVTDPRPLYTFHPALLDTIVPYVNRVNNK